MAGPLLLEILGGGVEWLLMAASRATTATHKRPFNFAILPNRAAEF
jgi:hypothetical protein